MSILKSRKFWLMITDAVVSLVLFFVAKYLNPSSAEDVAKIIGILQPVVISVILGIAVEDAALKSRG